MANNVLSSRMVIGVSFFVALVLQTIPWPGVLDVLRPSWLFLVTCYWVLMQNIMLFVALTMAVLAIQKLQDLYSFSNSFITYDLLAMRVVPYAYIYPFIEAYVAIGMVAELPALAVAPFSLFIGSIGAISVFKAVYIDKRELKCACVGGDSNVPLGFISLSENLFMIAAGIWMLSTF